VTDEAGPDDSEPPTETETEPGVLNFGSLIIPLPAGFEARVQADSDGDVQQILVTRGDSAMQVAAYAGVVGRPLWPGVRADIRSQLFEQGEAAQEIAGEFGIELLTQVLGEDGPVPVRFLAIDGSGWMVRGVIQGPAATDPELGAPFMRVLRGVSVVRGEGDLEPRMPLPLRLPEQARSIERSERDATPTEGQAR
jgi:hypothetical protein